MGGHDIIDPTFFSRLIARKKYIILGSYDQIYENFYENTEVKDMDEEDVFLINDKVNPELRQNNGQINAS
jgi:hypothetical protein